MDIKETSGTKETSGKPKHNVNYIRLTSEEMYLPSTPPSKKHQAFLNMARSQVLNLDTTRKDFLKKATKKMVKDVLQQEFGKAFMNDKGFNKMQEVIAEKILHTPHYREILQKLLQTIRELQSGD